MVSFERIITNKMLIDDLGLWDEFRINKTRDDTNVQRYYNLISNILDYQLTASRQWLSSPQARVYYLQESEYTKEIFQSLDDEWDDILSRNYDNVDELLEEIYRRGKEKGYKDIQERLNYTEQDKQALDFVRQYNFDLITKLSNDLRANVKNTITEGVAKGENPYSLANKLVQQGITPLEGSTLTAKQRAVMIAKTEVSRTQNTAILQTYANEGYTEVTILTAEDQHVCRLCLANAYHFNNDVEMVYSEDLKDQVHRISDLDEDSLLPLHPNCYMPDTQIYTKEGWKPVRDITTDDDVLTLNPENNLLDIVKPTRFIANKNTAGKMYHIYNDYFDTCVTPDHDCFVYEKVDDDYKPCFVKPPELTSNHHFAYSLPESTFLPVHDDDYNIEVIDYDGPVYCVELPKYHTLFTMRDGKTCWNGNCRCTYLSVWDSKCDVDSEPDVVNLTPLNNLPSRNNLNNTYTKYTPNDKIGLPNADAYSIEVKELTDKELFLDNLKKAAASQPDDKSWRVDIPDDTSFFDNCRMFITRNGSTVAIRDDGDIISVCANNSGNVKDSSSSLLKFATTKGGTKLDSFDGNYRFYRHCGFEPVSHVKFNEEYAPPGWIKERDEAEHVIFFKYTGKQSRYKKPEQFYENVPPVTGDDAYDKAYTIRDEKHTHMNKGMVIMKSENFDESKYPMTYKEYEKRVSELFLASTDSPLDLEGKKHLLKEVGDEIIRGEYESACYRYDNPEYLSNQFTDEGLIRQPVRILEMI